MQRKGNYITTFTGKEFYPYDMRPEDFCIEDIAHALSMLCRYGGHCRKFYSVAEHSVLVSKLVPQEHAYVGLMHDATEAYLVDMPRPIKVGFPQYKEMERSIWEHVADKFNLPLTLPDIVEQVDGEMLWHERAAILPPILPGSEWGMGRARPAVVHGELIQCWGPDRAEMRFLNRFEELTK